MTRRRLLRVGVWTLAVLLCLRLLLALLLIPLVGRVVGTRGLELRVHDHALSLWKGELTLDSVELRARDERGAPRGAPILELDWLRLDLSLTALLRGERVIERAELDGLRIEAERDDAGRLNWARHLAAAADAGSADLQPADLRQAGAADLTEKLAFDLPVEIEELRVGGVVLHWIDRARSTPLDAQLELEVSATALGSRSRAGAFRVLLHSPQLLESFRAEGTLFAAGRKLEGELELALERLDLIALAPELEELGVHIAGESLSSRLQARVALAPERAGAAAGELELVEWTAERKGLPLVDVRGVRLAIESLEPARLVIDSASVESARVTLLPETQHKTGQLLPAHAPVPCVLDGLELGRVELASPLPAQASSLSVRFHVPGVMAGGHLRAELRTQPESLQLGWQAGLEGVRPAAIESVLAEYGWRSRLDAGRLECSGSLEKNTAGVSVAIDRLQWSDGEPLWVVEGLRTRLDSGSGLELAAHELAALSGSLEILEDGRVRTAGMESLHPLLPPIPGGLALQPQLRALAARQQASGWSVQGEALLPPLFGRSGLALEHSSQTGRWSGRASMDALDLRPLAPLLAKAGLEPTLAAGALACEFSAEPQGERWDLELRQAALESAGVRLLGCETLALRGQELRVEGLFARLGRDAQGRFELPGLLWQPVVPPPAEPSATPAAVQASQTPQGLLPTLPALPPGLPDALSVAARIDWNDQLRGVALPLEFRLKVTELEQLAQNGTQLKLELGVEPGQLPLELNARAVVQPQALRGELRLALNGWNPRVLQPYLPPEWKLIEGAHALRGRFEWDIANRSEGGARLACAARELSWSVGSERWLECEALELGFERIDPQQAVVVPAGLRLGGGDVLLRRFADGRVAALGLESSAPLLDAGTAQDTRLALALERLQPQNAGKLRSERLRADLALPGWIEKLQCEWSASELGPRSWSFGLHLAAQGLHAQALIAGLPGVPDVLRAERAEGGSLSLDLEARVAWNRPMQGSFALRGLELRAPDGVLLAGLDALECDAIRWYPEARRGSAGELRVRTPHLSVLRDAQGLEIAGVRLLSSEPAAALQAASAPSEAAPAAAASAPAAAPAAAVDFGLRHIDIEGLDFEYLDTSGSEPTRLRMEALDFEVGRFSTRTIASGKSISFHGSLRGGKLPLPKVHRSGSLLALLAHAGGSLLRGGSKETVELEERTWLEELEVRGRLALQPELKGWVQAHIVALELLGLRALAREKGIEIGDGTLDNTLMVRLRGREGIALKNDSVFTNLSLSEPAGGPIASLLRLPAPLDTVLFLLKNDADEHRIPIRVNLGPEGLRSGEVTSAAVSATASVLTQAVASSPLRLLGGVTSLLGVAGEPPLEALNLAFEPGSVELSKTSQQSLQSFLRRHAGDERRRIVLQSLLGRADVRLAEERANPPAEDALALSQRLRQRRAEILHERSELLTRIRVDLATGDLAEAAQAREALTVLDVELGGVEIGLDQLHQRFDSGDERRVETRTKRFCLSLSRERAARLRQQFYEAGVSPERVELRPVKLELVADDGAGSVRVELRKRNG